MVSAVSPPHFARRRAIIGALPQHCFLVARTGEICGQNQRRSCRQTVVTYLEQKGNISVRKRRDVACGQGGNAAHSLKRLRDRVNFVLSRATAASGQEV